jgi:hypothetical protein
MVPLELLARQAFNSEQLNQGGAIWNRESNSE